MAPNISFFCHFNAVKFLAEYFCNFLNNFCASFREQTNKQTKQIKTKLNKQTNKQKNEIGCVVFRQLAFWGAKKKRL